MGYYINEISNGTSLPARQKADCIIADGGIEIKKPTQLIENLVCVVENGPFDAAAYIYSLSELLAFDNPNDARKKRWIIYKYAPILSGYDV